MNGKPLKMMTLQNRTLTASYGRPSPQPEFAPTTNIANRRVVVGRDGVGRFAKRAPFARNGDLGYRPARGENDPALSRSFRSCQSVDCINRALSLLARSRHVVHPGARLPKPKPISQESPELIDTSSLLWDYRRRRCYQVPPLFRAKV